MKNKILQKTISTGTHGHMVVAEREIRESLKLIDVVIEVLDSRIPRSSQNPIVSSLAKDKKRIVILNKIDLADSSKVAIWEKKYKEEGISVIRSDSTKGNAINNIINEIKKLGQEVCKESARKSKVLNPVFRVLIVGIPNVGKSTIINKLSKKTSAKVGNRPGVTLRKQWIRVGSNIELLDTPGILWPNLDDKKAGINLALTGNIKQEILDVEELAIEGIKALKKDEKYFNMLINKYKLDNIKIDDTEISIIENIGKNRGCLIKGGEIDIHKTSILFLDELKIGKIGNISLE